MPWMLVTLAAWAALSAGGTTAMDDPSAQRHELDRNQSLWTEQHLRDYRFRLRVRCFCPDRGRAVTVTVRNGRPHGAKRFQRELDTVPEMFSALRDALDDPRSGEVTVRYDTGRGFPRSASIDRIKNAFDDEISWTADRFRKLRR